MPKQIALKSVIGFLAACGLPALVLGSSCKSGAGAPAEADGTADDRLPRRSFMFRYKVVVPPIPEGTGPIDVFIPLAHSDSNQTIVQRTLVASIDGVEAVEAKYGNQFWHGHVAASDGKPITVSVEYEVSRSVFEVATSSPSEASSLTDAQRGELAVFLGANDKVPVQGDLIDRVLADLPEDDGTPLGSARVIYDYVIATMEYKKTGAGWGNGDTYWACSERYGNCTDFHALFISLARAKGIPARFEIGFPVPEDKSGGIIGGYHCWVEFNIAGTGWVPIDASEAWKHPEKRDLLFGTQPADRIQFTVGRDLVLGDGHASRPLNYFIYPHLEIGGKRSTDYTTEFSYDAL